MHSDPSEAAQQQAGPGASGDEPDAAPITEVELVGRNDDLDPEDAYGSLDDAGKAIWDASVRPIQG